MGLSCNLFSNSSKVLKNLRKHFLSVRNHTFLVKYDVTKTPKKYELVLMSIKTCQTKTNWDSMYIYIDAHVVIKIH